MSIFPVLPLVRDYNADKPSIFDTQSDYKLTEVDIAKIGKILIELKKLPLSKDTTIVLQERCYQMRLRYIAPANPRLKAELKTVSLPNIHKEAKKV